MSDDEARIGHNSNLNESETKKLKGIIREVERIDAQVRELASERGNIYKRAKQDGFDTKALKETIKLRRLNLEHRLAHLNSLDAYLEALGDLKGTPLGDAALKREGLPA
jgi:uncharacterized protein (UPF0335 family)